MVISVSAGDKSGDKSGDESEGACENMSEADAKSQRGTQRIKSLRGMRFAIKSAAFSCLTQG